MSASIVTRCSCLVLTSNQDVSLARARSARSLTMGKFNLKFLKGRPQRAPAIACAGSLYGMN